MRPIKIILKRAKWFKEPVQWEYAREAINGMLETYRAIDIGKAIGYDARVVSSFAKGKGVQGRTLKNYTPISLIIKLCGMSKGEFDAVLGIRPKSAWERLRRRIGREQKKRKITINHLAKHLRPLKMDYSQLRAFLKGKAPLTTSSYVEFEKAINDIFKLDDAEIKVKSTASSDQYRNKKVRDIYDEFCMHRPEKCFDCPLDDCYLNENANSAEYEFARRAEIPAYLSEVAPYIEPRAIVRFAGKERSFL